MQQDASTFADRVLQFYEENPGWTDGSMVITSPWAEPERRTAITEFYQKFFSDTKARPYVFGINPGRFVSTSTGVPYTDGYALEATCGISNSFSKAREMVATFIEKVVVEYGGAESFYGEVYAGAAFPFEILVDGEYRNYYDRDVWEKLRAKLLDLLKKMTEFGSNGKAVILGSADNRKFFEQLNGELDNPFEIVGALDHPRYIMQYKKSDADTYVAQYVDMIRGCV